MKESVTYQAIIEEGEALGISKGAVAEARRMLLLQGENRFGAPDARTAAALERIGDLQRLEELGVRLLNVASWQELLDRPASRRRKR